MKTLEKIEIEGEVRKVDWSLYAGATTGRQAQQGKDAFISLIELLNTVNGVLLSKYTVGRELVKIQIDEMTLQRTPIEFKSKTYKGLLNIKKSIETYGDEFIKFIRITEGNDMVFQVRDKKTNEVIEMTSSSYRTYVKAREKYMKLFKENNYKMLSAYKGAVEPILLEKEGVQIETTPSMFENTILKSITKFLNSLEITDTFIRFVDYTSVGYKAEISVIDEFNNKGLVQVHIGQYNKFKKNRKEIYNYIKTNNYTPKSIYKGAEEKMHIDFNCGHKPNWMNANSFKRGCGCPICAIEHNRGENHCCWKGGITELNNYLRAKINNWRVESFNAVDRRCCISNKKHKDNVVHHLIGFNTIVDEVLETLKYHIYEDVSYYTEEQLELMATLCLELHYKYGLGVVLTKELHNEFHNMYGRGNNTPEQFEEFKNNKLRELKEVV